MINKNELKDFDNFSLDVFNASKCNSKTLLDAMKYSFFGGGKRIRAQFVYVIGEAFNIDYQDCHKVAFAIEAIHTYSLIHDDLPAMDNDTIRRGKPTCHIKYSEATAILAGDALQTLAFEILQQVTIEDIKILKKINTLFTECCGMGGMVAGQQLDIEGENKNLCMNELELVHINKTAKMFIASILIPYLLSEYQHNIESELTNLSLLIGLCFQIKDDILDVTRTTEQLGKTSAKDLQSNKSTYVSLMGLKGAENYLKLKKNDINLIVEDLKTKNIECSRIEKLISLVIDRNH